MKNRIEDIIRVESNKNDNVEVITLHREHDAEMDRINRAVIEEINSRTRRELTFFERIQRNVFTCVAVAITIVRQIRLTYWYWRISH